MGRQRGQTSVEVRKLIIQHYENNKSLREISEIVDRSRSTVQYIIKRYKFDKNVENKSKVANNKIFSVSDEQYIVRQVKKDPFLSAPKLDINLLSTNEIKKRGCDLPMSMNRKIFHFGRTCYSLTRASSTCLGQMADPMYGEGPMKRSLPKI